MRALYRVLSVVSLILLSSAGGFVVAFQLKPELIASLSEPDSAAPSERKPLYYRNPMGLPDTSPVPKKDSMGMEYIAVYEDEPMPAADRKPLYYRNPMGLPDTSPVPKRDSMGMDYIPVYADEVDEPNTVKIATSKVQRTGFSSIKAERRAIMTSLSLPGIVAPDERLQSVISPRLEAFVESVGDITTGDEVRKGDPLLTLRYYDPEIVSAATLYVASLKASGLKSGKSKADVQGYRRRLENMALPEEVIKEIEKSGRADLRMTWLAPRDALVLERKAVDGMRAMPGDNLFKLADHSTVWVLADVPEANLGAAEIGQAARIRVRSFPGQEFEGRLALIYPELNEATRTVKVRIELPNPKGLLRPGMYADVELDAAGTGMQVAVPDSSVIDSGSRQVVIVEKGEGKFEPREVRIGRRGGGYVEILDGIGNGESVVTAANFLIDAESNLKAALAGLTGPGSAQ